MKQRKWYAVWRGRETGVFDTWAAAAERVSGYKGAQYKGFDSREAAQAALQGDYAAHVDARRGNGRAPADVTRLRRTKDVIVDSYSVDAACSGNPGKLEYRCVDNRTGRVVFHQGPFEDGTNNIGEFLAVVHALAWLRKAGSDAPIYCDSRNALKWVREKHCATRLARTERNAPLFDLVERAEAWLRDNRYGTRLLKWETAAWGEIPADFGRKKSRP